MSVARGCMQCKAIVFPAVVTCYCLDIPDNSFCADENTKMCNVNCKVYRSLSI